MPRVTPKWIPRAIKHACARAVIFNYSVDVDGRAGASFQSTCSNSRVERRELRWTREAEVRPRLAYRRNERTRNGIAASPRNPWRKIRAERGRAGEVADKPKITEPLFCLRSFITIFSLFVMNHNQLYGSRWTIRNRRVCAGFTILNGHAMMDGGFLWRFMFLDHLGWVYVSRWFRALHGYLWSLWKPACTRCLRDWRISFGFKDSKCF